MRVIRDDDLDRIIEIDKQVPGENREQITGEKRLS